MRKLIVSHNKKIVFSFTSSLILVSLATASNSIDDYLDLPLTDLHSMEVISVSKNKKRISDTTTIFVISRDNIRSS